MHSQKARGISACRDAVWIVIGLIDEMLGDDISDNGKALLMRTRGDLLGLLRVLTRAEQYIVVESRPTT